MTTLQAIVLAIIEGITDFCQFLLLDICYRFFLFFGIASDFHQTLYHCNSVRRYSLCSCFIFQTFLSDLGLYFKLFVAFIPAVVLGLLFAI
jgi:undecaprenyl-diphosphatase